MKALDQAGASSGQALANALPIAEAAAGDPGALISLDRPPGRDTLLAQELPAALFGRSGELLQTQSQVLVVDDEPAIRQLIRRMLEPEGYRVEEAGDGTEALRSLKSRPADCVITDICMPGMGGCDLIAALRRIAPLLPVIAITGAADTRSDSFQNFTRTFGVKRVLTKPFSTHQVLEAVRRLAEGSHQSIVNTTDP
jgi:CheY-like chemotaxis protein